jgi:hypothetical protein
MLDKQEAFAARAMANNYGRPVIGLADDVARLGRREVDAFFKRHYGPNSLTVTIVGDVDPAQVLHKSLRRMPSCGGSCPCWGIARSRLYPLSAIAVSQNRLAPELAAIAVLPFHLQMEETACWQNYASHGRVDACASLLEHQQPGRNKWQCHPLTQALCGSRHAVAHPQQCCQGRSRSSRSATLADGKVRQTRCRRASQQSLSPRRGPRVSWAPSRRQRGRVPRRCLPTTAQEWPATNQPPSTSLGELCVLLTEASARRHNAASALSLAYLVPTARIIGTHVELGLFGGLDDIC